MQKGGNKPLQMTHFRRMWQRHFPEVIIPKARKVFCAIAILQLGIWPGLVRATHNKDKRLSWTHKTQLHMEQQA